MVRKKRESKRVSLKKKYKIERKVKDHKKKLRSDARKNVGKKTPKKDPGIPNLWPFKEELLQDIERKRQKQAEELEQLKVKKKEAKAKKRKLSDSSVNETKKRARAVDADGDVVVEDGSDNESSTVEKDDDSAPSTGNKKGLESSRKAYTAELRKVIESSDVIIEVLDARDPMGTRCTEAEEMIKEADMHKRVILLLNKIDLVPKENAVAWLTRLREELPAVAFKCSTQKQRQHIAQSSVEPLSASSGLIQGSMCLGADQLLQLLKNYARSHKIKTSLTVGLIGMPNVGKSSVINSLKRCRAVNVANTPGSTKSVQEVHLDKHIRLLDCPGIVFSKDTNDPLNVLRNAVRIEKLEDMMTPVECVLERCKKEELMKLYKIQTFNTPNEFLAAIAHKLGKLKKGGIPDLSLAARTILQDWNRGHIQYYTDLPQRTDDQAQATIATELKPLFDLDALLKPVVETEDDSMA
mmetsp:Transcript_42569/g.70852  ORF Transcript_42569/g.70852 Transcript_42569/m.70852 type:complete len:467 (-) Transcript_42569:478-1878(-)